ncbi:Der1-like family-domain-containing protein [Tribonema minus]|uniref:Derlin n=1 Tax=Tribonema minus TaxID=303371 RepID=A0A836CBA0_9STRA|nr:Der1-like family-domain-containing protein [Tribonema minus]
MQRRLTTEALRFRCRVLTAKGGADDEDDEFDEDIADEDFEEGAVGNRIGQLWARTPYLTKRFFYVSFALTAYAFVFNKNAWPKLLDLEWDKVLRGQIWRVAATFFCFGALGMNCIISMYFVWTYMGELERMYFKRPQDFAMLMGFGALCLLVFTSLMGIHGQFLGHSREYEGVEVNVNDMFSLKAELLPWFFVAQTLVLEGEVPLLDLLGIFVGYLYMQLKIRKLIKAPEFVTQFFKLPAIAKDYKRFEREFGVENAGFDAAAAGVDADASEDSEGDSSAEESGEHSEE